MTKFNSTIFYSLLYCSLSIVSSCKGTGGITIDQNEEQLMVNSVDTLSITASTFLLDPLPSASTGVLLIGGTNDEQFGQVVLSSYFRLTNVDLSIDKLPENIQYDSLSLELFYNGYSYGDTTKSLQIEVHQLTEDIAPKELPIALEGDEYPVFVSAATLYTDQKFRYDPTSIGGITFHPKPKSKSDTLHIKLDDTLGKSLLAMAINNDSRLTNADEFVDFMKGLVLLPNGDCYAAVGLQDSVKLRIHYSYERQSDGKRVSDALALGIGLGKYQYNHIDTDRKGSQLAGLSYDNQEIAVSGSNYRTYIQGGTGVVTRLRFPTLRSFLNNTNISLNKATLIIETDQSEIGYYPPPSSLTLLVANKYGTPTSLVKGSNGNTAAIYQSAMQSGGMGKGRYEFNITDYVSTVKNQIGFDENQSLLLSLPTTDLMSTVNGLRLGVDNNKPAIKLHLLYINF